LLGVAGSRAAPGEDAVSSSAAGGVEQALPPAGSQAFASGASGFTTFGGDPTAPTGVLPGMPFEGGAFTDGCCPASALGSRVD
jgi:hypothetical protein